MKKAVYLLLVLAMIMGLTACGSDEETTAAQTEAPVTTTAEETTTEAPTTQAPTTTAAETTTEPETTKAELEEGMVYSYLTGLPVPEEIGNRRPISVMLNNIYDAIPQSGINEAGVVYEAPVEGTITRFMAFYENWDNLEKIGSVRSARLYYTYLSQEFKSVYVHFGQSKYTIEQLKLIDHLNGVDSSGDGVFYRTTDRQSPHNAYASGEGINKGIARYNFDMSYPEDYNGHYVFNHTGEPLNIPDAVPGVKAYPGYTYNKPWFQYNAEDGLYYRFQYGMEQIDDQTNEQTTCTNVIFQFCPSVYFDDNLSLDITTTGTGEGWFISGGQAAKITWQKDENFGVTHYYYANGEEITLNPGRTWVCIIQDRYADDVVIEE